MGKYILKVKPVEIKKYEFGMEDGFCKPGEYILADGEKYPKEYRSKKYPRYHREYDKILDEALGDNPTDWKPYIESPTSLLMVKINKSDYIIFTGRKKSVISKEEFETHYLSVDDIDKLDNKLKIDNFLKELTQLSKKYGLYLSTESDLVAGIMIDNAKDILCSFDMANAEYKVYDDQFSGWTIPEKFNKERGLK